MKREKLSSRLGFILLSAGCAIGLGNIWRFPYMVGEYGGGAFVLVYLFFLIVLGLPIIVMEYSVGRASKKSIAQSFQLLEKKGQKWHWFSYVAMIGNYLLVMFYTTISGWMLAYFVKMLKGDFTGLTTVEVGKVFTDLQADPMASIFWMILVVVIGCLICVLGLQRGVEKITKVMMGLLLGVMILLVIKSLSLLPRAIVENITSTIDGKEYKLSSIQLGGQRYVPEKFVNNVIQFVDNLYYNTDKVNYTFGIDLMYTHLSSKATSEMNGRYYYKGLEAFENNTPYRYAREVPVTDPTVKQSVLNAALYGQAQFKPFRGVDVTLGLRGDYSYYFSNPDDNELLTAG